MDLKRVDMQSITLIQVRAFILTWRTLPLPKEIQTKITSIHNQLINNYNTYGKLVRQHSSGFSSDGDDSDGDLPKFHSRPNFRKSEPKMEIDDSDDDFFPPKPQNYPFLKPPPNNEGYLTKNEFETFRNKKLEDIYRLHDIQKKSLYSLEKIVVEREGIKNILQKILDSDNIISERLNDELNDRVTRIKKNEILGEVIGENGNCMFNLMKILDSTITKGIAELNGVVREINNRLTSNIDIPANIRDALSLNNDKTMMYLAAHQKQLVDLTNLFKEYQEATLNTLNRNSDAHMKLITTLYSPKDPVQNQITSNTDGGDDQGGSGAILKEILNEIKTSNKKREEQTINNYSPGGDEGPGGGALIAINNKIENITTALRDNISSNNSILATLTNQIRPPVIINQSDLAMFQNIQNALFAISNTLSQRFTDNRDNTVIKMLSETISATLNNAYERYETSQQILQQRQTEFNKETLVSLQKNMLEANKQYMHKINTVIEQLDKLIKQSPTKTDLQPFITTLEGLKLKVEDYSNSTSKICNISNNTLLNEDDKANLSNLIEIMKISSSDIRDNTNITTKSVLKIEEQLAAIKAKSESQENETKQIQEALNNTTSLLKMHTLVPSEHMKLLEELKLLASQISGIPNMQAMLTASHNMIQEISNKVANNYKLGPEHINFNPIINLNNEQILTSIQETKYYVQEGIGFLTNEIAKKSSIEDSKELAKLMIQNEALTRFITDVQNKAPINSAIMNNLPENVKLIARNYNGELLVQRSYELEQINRRILHAFESNNVTYEEFDNLRQIYEAKAEKFFEIKIERDTETSAILSHFEDLERFMHDFSLRLASGLSERPANKAYINSLIAYNDYKLLDEKIKLEVIKKEKENIKNEYSVANIPANQTVDYTTPIPGGVKLETVPDRKTNIDYLTKTNPLTDGCETKRIFPPIPANPNLDTNGTFNGNGTMIPDFIKQTTVRTSEQLGILFKKIELASNLDEIKTIQEHINRLQQESNGANLFAYTEAGGAELSEEFDLVQNRINIKKEETEQGQTVRQYPEIAEFNNRIDPNNPDAPVNDIKFPINPDTTIDEKPKSIITVPQEVEKMDTETTQEAKKFQTPYTTHADNFIKDGIAYGPSKDKKPKRLHPYEIIPTKISSSKTGYTTNPKSEIKTEPPENLAVGESDQSIEEEGSGMKSSSKVSHLINKTLNIHKQNSDQTSKILTNILNQRKETVGTIEKPYARHLLGKIKEIPLISNTEIGKGRELKCSICGKGKKHDDIFHVAKDGEILHKKCFIGKGMTQKRKLIENMYGEDITESNPKTRKLYEDDAQHQFYNSLKNQEFETVHDSFLNSLKDKKITPNLVEKASSSYIGCGLVNERYKNDFTYLMGHVINTDHEPNLWMKHNLNLMRAKILLSNKNKKNETVSDLDTSNFDNLNENLNNNANLKSLILY